VPKKTERNLATRIFDEEGRPCCDVLLQYYLHGPTPTRIVDTSYRVLGQNPAMNRMCGQLFDPATPCFCHELIRAPELCHSPQCPLARILAGEASVEMHCQRETWDGRQFSGRVLAVPLRDGRGVLAGMIEITIDESDIVALNQQLEAKNQGLAASGQRLAAYSEVVRSLNRTSVPEELARTTMALLCRHSPAVLGVVYLCDWEQKKLLPLAAHALEGEIPLLAIGAGLPGQVAADGAVRFLTGIPAASFRFRSGCGEGEAVSLACFPLRVQERVLGVMELGGFSSLEEQGEFFLDTASELAVSLQHALAQREIERLVLRLREQNEELQSQSEELIAQSEEIQGQTEEIEAQRDDLERKSLEAEEANRLKSVFLANMSHELRTPLNALLGLSHLLVQGKAGSLSPQQEKYLEVIHRNGVLLLGQLDGILDLSRIEAGREDLRFDDIHLKGFLDTFAASMRPLAEQKELGFEIQLAPGLGSLVCDERKLQQVLTNLVSNAIKFTEKGMVRVTVNPSSREGQNWISFSVADTGIGIPPGYEQLIFEPFRQVDESSSRRYGGSGLGLSIARKIVEYLGGRIALKSEEGKGSVFTVDLPQDRRGKSRVPDEAWQCRLRQELLNVAVDADITGPAPPETVRGPGTHILVVDDDIVAVRELGLRLRRAGYRVGAAFNGQTGLEIVKKERPDLIVLEPEMVVMDGYAFLAGLTQLPGLSTIPVLVLGKKLPDEQRLEPHRKMVRGMLQKGNITGQELLERIRALLGEMQRPGGGGKVAPAAAVPEAIAAVAVPRRPGRPLLIAEDNPDNLFLVMEILQSGGYELSVARNGLEAVELARAARPALVLMDVQMPEMSGLEATRKLRQQYGDGLPIIALTARAMKGDRENFIASGFDDYLAKPVSPEALLAMVEQWLAKTAAREKGNG